MPSLVRRAVIGVSIKRPTVEPKEVFPMTHSKIEYRIQKMTIVTGGIELQSWLKLIGHLLWFLNHPEVQLSLSPATCHRRVL